MVKKALHTQKTACNGIGRLEGFGFSVCFSSCTLWSGWGGRAVIYFYSCQRNVKDSHVRNLLFFISYFATRL